MVFDSGLPARETPRNLRFRSPTEGKENDFVADYVENWLPKPRPGQKRAVFLEPELTTGYPDFVVVYWNVAATAEWPESRARLNTADLRLVHSLVIGGPSFEKDLRRSKRSGVIASLARLQDANLIYQRGDKWFARSPRKSFALRRLIAVEAKLDNWRQGAFQAVRNTWFASESYLLMPAISTDSEAANLASRLGVGLLTGDTSLGRPVVSAPRGGLPRSYASWLFNEWVWRAAIEFYQ